MLSLKFQKVCYQNKEEKTRCQCVFLNPIMKCWRRQRQSIFVCRSNVTMWNIKGRWSELEENKPALRVICERVENIHLEESSSLSISEQQAMLTWMNILSTFEICYPPVSWCHVELSITSVWEPNKKIPCWLLTNSNFTNYQFFSLLKTSNIV